LAEPPLHGLRAVADGGIEHGKEFDEGRADVGAVFEGVGGDEFGELFFFENAGVFGEEAEEEADEQQFEVAPAVARFFQNVVDGGHVLDGAEVGGFFFLKDFFREAGDELKNGDFLRQIRDFDKRVVMG